ncbi:MAG: DNRLRE domain-containing protein, partial [Euryarchaeota archaeon]|nr:DNRLRE domain-containing protein [Euryarchaeota archaeon]
ALDSTSPDTNFGSDEIVDFGTSTSGESRILISFNNTVPSGELVTDATLELTCGIDLVDIDTITIYAARMKRSWNEANANWNSPNTGLNWGLSGGEGDSDHGEWEPPFQGYGNNTFTINTTAIVQDAVINSRSTIDLLVAASGALYSCHLSESAATT